VGVRVGGPNAGHTVVDKEGRVYPLRQVPVGAVADPSCYLVIAAGSELDMEVLEGEIRLLEADGHSVINRLFVDRSATVIHQGHRDEEQQGLEAGSTRKGIGAARAARAMRTAPVADNYAHTGVGQGVKLSQLLTNTRHFLSQQRRILIEGTQGFALGSHAGFYPHCTSGDCRAIDFLAQAGIPPNVKADVWVVLRTHPIRIAGDSGPLMKETTWTAIGVEPEFTTVTKKMRRVGQWDKDLAATAIEANGGEDCSVALTFFDYWHKELHGASDRKALTKAHWKTVREVEGEIGAPVHLLGTGPASHISLLPEVGSRAS